MKRLSRHHTLDVYTLDTANTSFCGLSELANGDFVFDFSPATLFRSPLGRLNRWQRWRDLHKLDALSRRIAGVIDDKRYDVVLAQPCMWTQAPLVLRHLRTPALYYCQEPPRHLHEAPFRVRADGLRCLLDRVDPLISLYEATARRLDRLATQAATTVLVNSHFSRGRVAQIYGVTAAVSYHGVDTAVFRPSGERRREAPYVLSVGAIQPHKGFDFVIDALSRVDRAIRPPLLLVGNMENAGEQALLRALAARKCVDLRIEVGATQSALVDRYSNAALVAYAPHNEPFGLVPLESMACGTPVVGVREGGVTESVVHEQTGLLVERDAERFGGAIQHLLESPELAETYGRNGRTHVVQHWSWDRAISILATHLERCAA